MIYGVSIVAKRQSHINHAAVLVEAETVEFAYAQGCVIAQKAYPVLEGWSDHHVTTTQDDRPVSPTDSTSERTPFSF